MVHLPANQPQQRVVPVGDLEQHVQAVGGQVAPLDVGQLMQEHVLGVSPGELAQVPLGHQQHRPDDAEDRGVREPPRHDDLRDTTQPQAVRAVGHSIVEGLRQ